MRKIWLSIALVVMLAIILLPRKEVPHQAQIEQLNPAQEMQAKQALLNQDVRLTEQLCRLQCMTDLHLMANGINSSDKEEIKQTLSQMQAKHQHMLQLIWILNGTPLSQGIKSGSLNTGLDKAAAPYLTIAKSSAERGVPYQSPTISSGGKAYFVVGIPLKDKKSSIVGIVHQDILQQVTTHQMKNLRLVPYPSPAKYKMKAVDSNTMSDVKVRTPEDNQGASHYHVNEVVVKFKQEPTRQQFAQIHKDIQTSFAKKLGNTYVFRSKQMEAKQLMDYFNKHNIVYVEPHYLYMTNESPITDLPATDLNAFVPNDLLYSKYQWNLPIIDTTQGWGLTKGSPDVLVAVVDTGVDLTHPDLQSNLVTGYNVIDNTKPPQDDVGHGSHVSGIIAAIVNNNEGIAGMSWFNKILPVKVLDQSGAGSTYNVAEGIIWAADHGAKVINLSLGNYAEAQFLHDAVKYAFDKDVVLIAASGNDNSEQPGYPAAYPEVFAVSAIDSKQKRAPFSNYGDYISAMAPGVSIASTYMNHQYAALSGTSMASPHVAALAGLIRSINPNLKNTEVMDIMRKTAIDLGDAGKDKYYGSGQIDVVKALQAAEQSKSSNSQKVCTIQ